MNDEFNDTQDFDFDDDEDMMSSHNDMPISMPPQEQSPVVAPRFATQSPTADVPAMPTVPEVPEVPEVPQQINNVVDDSEVKMAQSQLYVAAKSALELHKMLKFVNELEGWCQAKITLASQNLEAVKNYIEYEMVSATLNENDASAGMVVENPQDYKIYHNSPKVAAKLGWKNSPQSCHGNTTSKYVIHDPQDKKFIFTDNPKKHEVMEDFIKKSTQSIRNTFKKPDEYTALVKRLISKGMSQADAKEVADETIAYVKKERYLHKVDENTQDVSANKKRVHDMLKSVGATPTSSTKTYKAGGGYHRERASSYRNEVQDRLTKNGFIPGATETLSPPTKTGAGRPVSGSYSQKYSHPSGVTADYSFGHGGSHIGYNVPADETVANVKKERPLHKVDESKEVWDEKNPAKKHHKLSPEKKAAAKKRAKEAGRPYPNMVDNMWAAKK